MATITLKDYQYKIAELLLNGNTEEVIRHCTHILATFPKNATVYRHLGEALMSSRRWEEAVQVFRRVLTAYPDDYACHRNLAVLYTELNQPDSAIWHYERAYESNHADLTLNKTLLELYQSHKNFEGSRLPITAGTAARQFKHNGLYNQAIDTLLKVLKRSPHRMDLLLLLSQTYWEANRPLEAARAAIEVLKVLPFCYEANKILARLWLSQGKPSDAHPYLSHMEQIAPYDALELLQNILPQDHELTLETFDDNSLVQNEGTSAVLNWAEVSDLSDSVDNGISESPVEKSYVANESERILNPIRLNDERVEADSIAWLNQDLGAVQAGSPSAERNGEDVALGYLAPDNADISHDSRLTYGETESSTPEWVLNIAKSVEQDPLLNWQDSPALPDVANEGDFAMDEFTADFDASLEIPDNAPNRVVTPPTQEARHDTAVLPNLPPYRADEHDPTLLASTQSAVESEFISRPEHSLLPFLEEADQVNPAQQPEDIDFGAQAVPMPLQPIPDWLTYDEEDVIMSEPFAPYATPMPLPTAPFEPRAATPPHAELFGFVEHQPAETPSQADLFGNLYEPEPDYNPIADVPERANNALMFRDARSVEGTPSGDDLLSEDKQRSAMREIISLFVDETPQLEPIADVPEWLDAMVPGLDFNINEADNAPIETTFIELQQPAPRVTFSASQSQFNPDDLQWLVDIVDEETVAIAQPKRRPRFIFSRPPLWLRRQQPNSSPNDETSIQPVVSKGNPSEPSWLSDAFDEDKQA